MKTEISQNWKLLETIGLPEAKTSSAAGSIIPVFSLIRSPASRLQAHKNFVLIAFPEVQKAPAYL